MDISLFDYSLPEELVARHPAPERDQSRLFVIDRMSGSFTHEHFSNIGKFLRRGDLLVLNDTRVIPARLMGQRLPGGGKVETLLLKEIEPLLWQVMVKPAKKIHTGDRIVFQPKLLEGEVTGYIAPGERLMHFTCRGDWWETLDKVGHTPLPPYILKGRRDDLHTDLGHTPLEESEDRVRYQTIYARVRGSVAAPTAGLHFSEGILDDLKTRGIEVAFVTLHIGAGTFKPVTTERVEDHPMHWETYHLTTEDSEKINHVRMEGHRIIPVGTTSVRTLETCADMEGFVHPASGETRLLIIPGYRFKCADALLTNFHLPRTTLLMLVCAFGGRELILRAYEEAVRERYRFYSFGDAMLIL
jgi:S-adenosylmethionine:tRNA ribosyltransferase-isomerase